jgi:hypothetical protein
MIRYLYSKVNLWAGKYFFSMKENKVIDKIAKKRGLVRKADSPVSSIKWGLASFVVRIGILYWDSPLSLPRKSSLSPFLAPFIIRK